MSSLPEERVGVASGINNAVSRTAGLLAVALFGIVMLHSFNQQLGRRLAQVRLSPAAQPALGTQRDKLAGAEIPSEVATMERPLVRRAIDESFVDGFRVVMCLGTLFAVASAISAWLIIPSEPRT